MVKSKLKFAVSLISLFGLWGCDYLGTFPKNIREFPEPWQVLEPGKPIENPPKVEIVTQGGGKYRAWGFGTDSYSASIANTTELG